jgi:four helix bundle protein
MAREYRFNFKRLDAYQAAVEHFRWTVEAVADFRAVPFVVRDQILDAALSIAANIAEANGRTRMAGEAEQHYRYAQGSTYETAAYLDALAALGVLDDHQYNVREANLARIAAMLDRLTRKQAARRS